MNSIDIAGRPVGGDGPVFVIAEIGVNHDGEVGKALDLVQAAADAAADAVNLQVFDADRLAGTAPLAQSPAGMGDQASLLRGLELSPAEIEQVCDAATEAGLVPLVTPFSPEDLALVAYLGLPAVKIASPDLVNDVLLTAAAELGLPLLLSTGAATAEEVHAAAAKLRGRGATFAILHCISSYPTQDIDAHLGWIEELEEIADVPVGYSDHTNHADAGALAVAAGACLIEKHLTYDRAAAGPEHASSFAPLQLADYVRRIRVAEALVGRGRKRVLPSEQDVRQLNRQSLVMRHTVEVGQIISYDDLTTRRPGDGIPPAMVHEIVGRAALTRLPAGCALAWQHLRPAMAA